MIQIVNELASGGHQIDFYVRNDGGILIRSIDGEHFAGAKGNARAREMTGQNLSEARFKQLKFATASHKASIREKKLNLPQPDDQVMKEYARVKKIWNKAFKSKAGKPHPSGYFSKRGIKYVYRTYGKEEALRRIGEAERYATGTAYQKNVEHLAYYIKEAGEKYESEELKKLAQDVLDNAYMIKEDYIYPAYQKLYELNIGVDPKQVAQETRLILRL